MPSSCVGCRQSQLLEEDRRELLVVVLPGVDQDLLVACAQRAADRRGLDELRPVADHRGDAHQPSSDAIRSRTSSAISRVRGPGAS
jgi:hypothetical protein